MEGDIRGLEAGEESDGTLLELIKVFEDGVCLSGFLGGEDDVADGVRVFAVGCE